MQTSSCTKEEELTWLYESSLRKFEGFEPHYSKVIHKVIEATKLVPGGWGELYNLSYVLYELGCRESNLLKAVRLLGAQIF
jgi:hypothetical protein